MLVIIRDMAPPEGGHPKKRIFKGLVIFWHFKDVHLSEELQNFGTLPTYDFLNTQESLPPPTFFTPPLSNDFVNVKMASLFALPQHPIVILFGC